ncbi:hypothetical protein [Anabaena sp. UHCC 0451]|uniref:hypothetical protein n=1 Tax=Anabaena sp. UHCC 0451 TaxID=2055235 RepID=UPI002B21C9FD|nr:hypothetical protein [Anabaena sp. UHCC 0451]MEA5578725.1 hypothetical protein [Anabaena sp. UHCC 0451]
MNVTKSNQLLINIGLLIAIALSVILMGKLKPQDKPAIAQNPIVENADEEDQEEFTSPLQKDRPLRMSLSVDNPSYLKVRLNDEIKIGDIISDNSTERQRLERQKKSIKLQIDNLKSKTLIAPTPPPPTPLIRSLPDSAFEEEQANISQAELKLQQAKSILNSRSKLLTTDNPERRAEFEKAGASLAIASQKIQEQEQMIAAMNDMKMQPEILQHEQSKLRKLQSELDQARSEVEQSQAKLSAAAIIQSQELEQLKTNVILAESELKIAKSRLESAINRRQIQEYQASVEESKRSQTITQSNQDYERSRLQYEEATRNKDYQLAQLGISLSAIEDKLADIPIVRSPRNGYIKKVKPWVGKDGKYTTTITIVSNNISLNNKSSNGTKSTITTNTDSNTDKPR